MQRHHNVGRVRYAGTKSAALTETPLSSYSFFVRWKSPEAHRRARKAPVKRARISGGSMSVPRILCTTRRGGAIAFLGTFYVFVIAHGRLLGKIYPACAPSSRRNEVTVPRIDSQVFDRSRNSTGPLNSSLRSPNIHLQQSITTYFGMRKRHLFLKRRYNTCAERSFLYY